MTPLLSQAADTSGIDPNLLALASISGVVTLTTLLIQRLVKPLSVQYPPLARVPTLFWMVVIASGLTYVANRVLHTLPGDNVWRLVQEAVVAILASGGLYVMPEAAKPIGTTKTEGIMLKKDDAPTVADEQKPPPRDATTLYSRLAPLLLLLFVGAGCTPDGTAGPSPFLRGIEAQWPPVRDAYRSYLRSDATLTERQREHLWESTEVMDELITVEGRRVRQRGPDPLPPAPLFPPTTLPAPAATN